MVKGAYSDAFSVFYFNLDAPVGPGCQNRPDDVELVRYGLYCLTQAPGMMAAGPNERAFLDVARAVGRSGPYDPSIATAVLAYQRARGLTEDSKVSVIQGNFTPRGNTYVLQTMQANMRDVCKGVFPRIDLVPDTGPILSRVVRHMFILNN